MKKSILILTIFFALVANCNLFAQNSYAVLGNTGVIRWIMKFQLLDEQTHIPIRNALVEMKDNNSLRFSIRTNEKGMALVFIEDIRYIPNPGKIIITCPGYNYWEKEVYQYQIMNGTNTKLTLADPVNGGLVNWSCLNCVPPIQKIAEYIFRGAYDDTHYFTGPSVFEYNLNFQRINSGSNYQQNNSNQGGYSQNYNNGNLQQNHFGNGGNHSNNGINGWGVFPTNNIAAYKKGDLYLVIREDNDSRQPEKIIVEVILASRRSKYLDNDGLLYDYTSTHFTKEEAFRVARIFMQTH